MKKEQFAKLAPFLARCKADELEMKNGLMKKREDYIQEEEKKIEKTLEKNWKEFQEKLSKASKILEEEATNLSRKDKERIIQEGSQIKEKMKVQGKNHPSLETSLQDFFGISNETLLWVYQVGCKCIEKNNTESATALFAYLVALNPMVFDYWNGFGFALKAHGLYEEALYAFSFAALLKANDVKPRYQLVQIYIHLGKFEDAKVEMEVLQELIKEQNIQELKSICEDLETKIRMRRAA